MIIKEGYSGKPFELRISATENRAEVNTEMYIDLQRVKSAHIGNGRVEVLHYATITELIELRDEINKAIKVLAGV